MIERILTDAATANPDWKVALLRYFNPVGAHPSGRIGEDPKGYPNNLMPILAQVAVGRRDHLTIHGNDYPTKDGTGERDYIHVMDLAAGHVAALSQLPSQPEPTRAYNLGSGHATSVFELLHAFEQAARRRIPYRIGPRRPGDLSTVYADPSRAANELNWRTTRTIKEMCEDTWRWQSANPNGYAA